VAIDPSLIRPSHMAITQRRWERPAGVVRKQIFRELVVMTVGLLEPAEKEHDP
jgi:hypothetical protein